MGPGGLEEITMLRNLARAVREAAVSLAVCSIVLPSIAAAQSPARSPGASAVPETEAAALYRNHCASCHGDQGQGGRGPGFQTGRFRHGDSDEQLMQSIRRGIPGTIMPMFYYDERQLRMMVAHIRDFSIRRSEPAAVRGNAAVGRELFSRAGCAGCHVVNGVGGRGGPDLSEVGAVRAPQNLRQSLTDPSADIEPRLYAVRAVTKKGEELYGRRLNIGTFSVQLHDTERGLVSVWKSDLESFEIVKESMMPSYREQFSAEQLDDLTAYLGTLLGEETSQ